MIVIGLICLLLALLTGYGLLWTVGIILIIVGAILWALGTARTGGRRWY
jgi:uncharacterized membrane protein HdeD (DUF308 family)